MTYKGLLNQELSSFVIKTQQEPHRSIKAECFIPTCWLQNGKKDDVSFQIWDSKPLYTKWRSAWCHNYFHKFFRKNLELFGRMQSTWPPKVVCANRVLHSNSNLEHHSNYDSPYFSYRDQFCIYRSYMVLGFWKYNQNVKTNLAFEGALSLLIGPMTGQNTTQRKNNWPDRNYLKGIYVEKLQTQVISHISDLADLSKIFVCSLVLWFRCL